MNKAKTITKRLKTDIDELSTILDGALKASDEPKGQAKATKLYDEKMGLATKSYKLNSKTADLFKESCKANEESQAEVLTRLMTEYCAGTKSKSCWFCKLKSLFKKKTAE
jgi:hypothetical protein